MPPPWCWVDWVESSLLTNRLEKPWPQTPCTWHTAMRKRHQMKPCQDELLQWRLPISSCNGDSHVKMSFCNGDCRSALAMETAMSWTAVFWRCVRNVQVHVHVSISTYQFSLGGWNHLHSFRLPFSVWGDFLCLGGRFFVLSLLMAGLMFFFCNLGPLSKEVCRAICILSGCHSLSGGEFLCLGGSFFVLSLLMAGLMCFFLQPGAFVERGL